VAARVDPAVPVVSEPEPDGLLDQAFDELAGAVPRLISRTRRQVLVARSLASHLPCLGGLAPRARHVDVPPHERVAVTVTDVLDDDWDDSSGTPGTGHTETTPTDGVTEAAGHAPAMPASEPVPDPEDLPLRDYDALAASQVVPRLATLTPDELDLVRRYERGHRNRQTILNRVGQLLADGT